MKNDRLERGALSLEEIRAKLEEAQANAKECKRMYLKYPKMGESYKKPAAMWARLVGYWKWRERAYFDRYNKTTL